jgi:hypothetical protein
MALTVTGSTSHDLLSVSLNLAGRASTGLDSTDLTSVDGANDAPKPNHRRGEKPSIILDDDGLTVVLGFAGMSLVGRSFDTTIGASSSILAALGLHSGSAWAGGCLIAELGYGLAAGTGKGTGIEMRGGIVGRIFALSTVEAESASIDVMEEADPLRFGDCDS